MLLYKACGVYGDSRHIIFKEDMAEIADAARRYSYDGIERIIHSIDKARSRLKANVNLELTMELMLLDMKAG